MLITGKYEPHLRSLTKCLINTFVETWIELHDPCINQIVVSVHIYPTEVILQRHLQCDISDTRQHWVITT